MRRGLSWIALFGCACAVSNTNTVTVANPRTSAWEGPSIVRVAEKRDNEVFLNLPAGALTSETALVSADEKTVCFDVKMRSWQGATPEWDLELLVDENLVLTKRVKLNACTQASLEPSEPIPLTLEIHCLPPDSAFYSSSMDARDSIKVRGARVCLEHGGHLTPDAEQVELTVTQNAASSAFVWQFAARTGN